jgi:hypothetical protein
MNIINILKKMSRTTLLRIIMLLTVILFFQYTKSQITVTGTVTGDNEPLIGASVLLKGSTSGTVTNAEGKYSITVPSEEAILTISFLGYLPEEIVVGGRKVIDVILLPDVQSLAEIIVIGYGTQKKSDLTGAVASIRGEELVKTPVINIDQAMQGRAAGIPHHLLKVRQPQ